MPKRNSICAKMFLVNNNFGLWLQRKREEKGLTQAKLAAKAGLNRAVINKIESGQSKPEPETLQSIADALEISDEEIFRAIGYLRTPPDDAYDQEFKYLLSGLSEEEKKEVLDFIRFKRQQKIQNKPPSRAQKPARTVLKEK